MKPSSVIALAMSFFFADGHADLKQELQTLIRAQPGLVAVAFKDLHSGATLFINEKKVLHAASTMKLAVMIEVYRQADQGRFSLNDSLIITNRFRSIVDGSPFSLPIPDSSGDPTFRKLGQKLTRRDLVYDMITWSSNLATNLLIDQVGSDNVQKTIHGLGVTKMRVRRGVEDSLAFAKGWNNVTCAQDLLILLQAIHNGQAASANACRDMIDILLEQHFRENIPALLPPEVRVAHKTGSITAIHHDAGLVFLPDGRCYILVVLTKGFEESKQSSDLISRISRRIYEAMNVKG